MKSIVTIFALTILLFSQVFSQQGCPVKLTPEQRAVMFAKRNIEKPAIDRKSMATKYVPIKVHIVCQTNTSGGKNIDDIFVNLCEMNEAYDSNGMQFYIHGDLHFINNSNFYSWEYGGPEGDELMELYNEPNVINCYFVNEVTGLCGYAFFPGSGPGSGSREGGMVLINGCVGTANTTWQHEMGHYMNLSHTFDGYGGWGAENVARSGPNKNCNWAGDGFCDTPADNLPDRWSCPYTGTELDNVGDPYNPDPSYFMSYANDNCTSRFSDQEKDATLDALTIERPYLLTFPNPYLGNFTGVTTSVSPSSSATVPANSVDFKWTSVPGAEVYLLEVVRVSGVSSDRLMVFIPDTFVTVINHFTQGISYRWKVKPITRLFPCHPSTGLKIFTAGAEIVLPLGISESNNNDVSIFPNPASNVINLQFKTTIAPNATVTLYSNMGSEIAQYNLANNGLSIATQQLASGIYFLKIQNGLTTSFKKVVIE
jgi:hypothetical protein